MQDAECSLLFKSLSEILCMSCFFEAQLTVRKIICVLLFVLIFHFLLHWKIFRGNNDILNFDTGGWQMNERSIMRGRKVAESNVTFKSVDKQKIEQPETWRYKLGKLCLQRCSGINKMVPLIKCSTYPNCSVSGTAMKHKKNFHLLNFSLV